MPFPVRPINPTHLSNGELPADVDNQLECITNATLAQAMRQLACLLRQADDLFLDLGTQCNNINLTTVRINKRVTKLKEKVDNYNPKKEKLPAGDLGTFSKLKVHFKTEYPIETNLFTKNNRTQAIKTLYTKAGDGKETEVNRDDVVCLPVLSDPNRKQNLYLEIETRLPSNYEEFSSRLDDHDSSHKQGNIALKSELVRVDVSGRSFAQMTDYRRSLLPANPRRKRRKNRDRRNTLAGGEKFNLIVENQNRARSHEGQRKPGRSLTPGDVDISLDATTGSSLCTGTIPDMDTSLTSSYADKTLSDIHLPPPLPELKSNAQMKKLRSLGKKKRGETNNPFINNDSEYHQYTDEDGLSPIFSDKDFGQENYYESLSRVRTVPGRSMGDALITKGCSNPDGALSSSGIWTASVSEGSDREDNVPNTPSRQEITTPRVLQRPHSSLSMGIISDTESAAETTHEESNNTLTVLEPQNADEGEEGSIHSCDTEGYYTTFHDFDGFQEIANELKLIDSNENANPFLSKLDGNSNLFICEEKEEVVFRKKSKRPPLPRRQSSLIKDNRESTDTVIHISDLQELKNAYEAHDLSNDISFDFSVAGSDIESSEHIQRLELKTAMTSRHIPSMCVVTPPLSDEDSRKTSANTSLNISRSSSESPDKNQVIINNMQQGEDNFEEKFAIFNSDNGNHRNSGNSSDKDCLDSDNSVITVDSGKLVSITPDIVKPVKECKPDLTKANNSALQHSKDHEVNDMQEGPNPVLNSNSGSHLPDMLTNTPEVSQITGDSSVIYNQAQQLNSMPDSMVAKNNLGINSEMPGRPAIGLALGHANKTSCMENHAENSAQHALLSSVSTGLPNCEQPKLRITSPFSAYSKKHVPDEDEKPSNQIPPSTLLGSQGDLERKHEEIEPIQNRKYQQVFERNVSVGNQLSHPEDIYNRVNQTLSRMNTDTSAGHISNGIDGTRNSVQRSSLKRSDSYRRARPILSPDLSKNNRKSLEISQSNTSANLSNNSTNISFGNGSSSKSTNNNSTINTPNCAVETDKFPDEKEKSVSKGNFFKNIRSQFSFSSLRRKPSKKTLIEITSPIEQKKSSDVKRRNSFSSLSSSNKTPDQPRMTSTPNSDYSLKNTSNNIEHEKPKVKPSSEWSESPKNSAATPVKFRTAALKNQHQRWSFAEQLQSNNQQSMHMPNNASYGYIYPNQYMLAGHVNTPHGPNIYQQIHHQPHHPPHHHPVPGPNRTYGSYGPSTSNPIYAGSQRSSIASLRGLPHDPPSNTQTLTKYEDREEGAYGYSVSRRNSLSPPSKPSSDTQSTGRSSQLSNNKSCDCPMCYHSVKNPCNDCGCPSRTSSMSLKVNVKQRGPAFTDQQSAQAFFSPSSDYYSLSPNSPPPEDLQLNQPDNGYSDSSESSQPIYAKVNKNKSSDVKNNVSDKRIDESRRGQSVDKTNFNNNHQPTPKNGSVSMHQRSTTEPGKKPAAPERDLNVQKDKSGRRHSWAGDKKGPGIQKQTSLHDFKKLLAQQAMGQNPHRMSAKELLEKSITDNEAHEPCKSSQKSGGSLRKRSSPWKDNRFSVIQEEIEGSKENLLNGKN
eukprot:TRINITY_DN989_c0_g1_i1.p1 TRINITY_DN989_c0_g1~~TRINITY_DN989_c0_g1_i1.p1  ORF type:complete len:1577 (+),score=288.14 TRINITY_DN989_c0_g1_i1:339-5069(+)